MAVKFQKVVVVKDPPVMQVQLLKQEHSPSTVMEQDTEWFSAASPVLQQSDMVVYEPSIFIARYPPSSPASQAPEFLQVRNPLSPKLGTGVAVGAGELVGKVVGSFGKSVMLRARGREVGR